MIKDAITDPYCMRLPRIARTQLEQIRVRKLSGSRILVGEIGRASPLRLRQAAAQLARWFRREFRYDFAPYDGSCDSTIFVWADGDQLTNGRVPLIGAAGFFIEDELASRPWTLGWAWFHPYARRRGYLSQAWPYFRRRFGGFILQTPLSEAMEAFLAQYDPRAVARTERAEREESPAGEPDASSVLPSVALSTQATVRRKPL